MAEYSLLLQLLSIDQILVINYLQAEETFTLLLCQLLFDLDQVGHRSDNQLVVRLERV